jgi:hypothetical protein
MAGLMFAVAMLTMAVPARTASPSPAPRDPIPARNLSQPMELGIGEVLIGAYVQNIQSIDPATNSFMADLYVWYRWTDPDLKPYESVEIMNLHEAWQLTELGKQTKPRLQSDGSYYFAERYTGAFNSPLSLVKFPFGTQYLSVILEDSESEKAKLRFIADDRSTSSNPRITLPGYTIGEPTMVVTDFAYDTDFGQLNGTIDTLYSQATVTIPVSTPGLSNLIKYLVPIALIVAAASLVFYLPPTEVEGRIALGITALLTLVAMEWSATESLPTVAYLTMLDVLYIVGTLFILASLILGIRTAWMARESSEETAIHSDERMLYVFLGTFALVFGLVLGAYLLA